MKNRRVVVAMSGGVDSSVAAALLHEEGYDVLGVGLRLPEPPEIADSTGCCGMAGMQDARAVAHRIGIPFYTLDYREVFEREVIEPFCVAYACGRTPNPCAACNVAVKFGRLLQMARALDAAHLATGHYARCEAARDAADSSYLLLRGVDPLHDQSYFLYGLAQGQLASALFPLGRMRKAEVRQAAQERGLPVADKASSQDICFIGAQGYRAFVAARHPEAFRPGPIVDLDGHELGRHRGIAAYTIGQRKGLGVAASEPLYVVGMDVEANTLMVGPRGCNSVRHMRVEPVNWVAGHPPTGSRRLSVSTRYQGVEAMAEVRPEGEGALAWFERPHPMAAPSQAAVFYDGDVVVGGGEIVYDGSAIQEA